MGKSYDIRDFKVVVGVDFVVGSARTNFFFL